MDEKLIKKMIYMTIILFIFIFVSFIFAKKSTSDLKREQELIEQQLDEQENKYRANENANNEEPQQNRTATANRDVSQYIDENTELTENNSNNEETSSYGTSTSYDSSTENQTEEQKSVEITKLADAYVAQGYAIVKDFQVNSTKFAIISKKSEYQSEYAKSTKKKYYIYKYIGQNLYETAYIMDVSIPKDKEGNEPDIFKINVNGNTVEIKIDILSNASRQYNKQRLLSTPIAGANVLRTETVTVQTSN